MRALKRRLHFLQQNGLPQLFHAGVAVFRVQAQASVDDAEEPFRHVYPQKFGIDHRLFKAAFFLFFHAQVFVDGPGQPAAEHQIAQCGQGIDVGSGIRLATAVDFGSQKEDGMHTVLVGVLVHPALVRLSEAVEAGFAFFVHDDVIGVEQPVVDALGMCVRQGVHDHIQPLDHLLGGKAELAPIQILAQQLAFYVFIDHIKVCVFLKHIHRFADARVLELEIDLCFILQTLLEQRIGLPPGVYGFDDQQLFGLPAFHQVDDVHAAAVQGAEDGV